MPTPTIKFESAQITRRESGPDRISLVGKDQKGATRDFDIELPRDAGDAYLRELGFDSWLLLEPGLLRSSRGGREYAGTVEVSVTAAGQRTVLTKQAVDFVEA